MKTKLMVLTFLLALSGRAATNTVPLISDVSDQVIAQNTGTGTNYFTIGDTETDFSALTVSAGSANTNLVPNSSANLILGGSNAQRTIKVVPVTNQTGMATITLTVSDGTNTAISSFLLTVTPPNTPPSISGLTSYQIVSPGQTPVAVSFVIGDTETAAGNLSVVATSSNTNIVPNTNIILGGNGSNRTVQVTPVDGQCGVAVIKLKITDSLGASAQSEFIFSVFDAASANNSFKQPRGIYVLDSVAGTNMNGVSMRDANVRNKPFVDGYVLRTEWATLEPANGIFNFTIISNIFAKLPSNQKLSLMLASGVLPAWLNTVPGVTTYTAGTPSVTRPLPWDAVAQERYRLLLVALGDYVVDGVPLRNHPRLAAMDAWIPGLKSGIRDPDEIKIRDLPGYSRTNMQTGVLRHLANVTDNFPNVPVQIGFWAYTDATNSPAAWEVLRQAILAQHDGTARPCVGFWMENLAANRPAADTDPWSGLPTTSYTAPLYLSQTNTFVGYQVLGSWSRPFSAAHVDNNLNGSPEDGMDYGFNVFQCRYYEHYQADIDFANYTAEFQRWHDFLNALPGPPLPLVFGSSQGGVTLAATNSAAVNITLSATGGTAPYTWSLIAGTLPAGITLSNGVLTGTLTASGAYTFTLQATDATGGSASQEFTLTVAGQQHPALIKNSDKSVTITWPAVTGGWYQVEVSSDLVNWALISNSVRAASASMNWIDDGARTGAHPSTVTKRFYRVRDWGVFEVTFSSNRFTYTDSERTVTGLFTKPAGSGRFPALIINHGTNLKGTGASFYTARAGEMGPWGLACIAPDLTHVGSSENLETWGYSPENLARDLACLAALSTRDDIDLNRLAMWGHSRGSFASIGVASVLRNRLKALGFSAGGVLEDTDSNEGSFPSVTEASGITAPTIMFHGTGDGIVLPATSQRLQDLLNTLGTVNYRQLYDTGTQSGSESHNLYSAQNADYLADMLTQWRAWLVTSGVLP